MEKTDEKAKKIRKILSDAHELGGNVLPHPTTTGIIIHFDEDVLGEGKKVKYKDLPEAIQGKVKDIKTKLGIDEDCGCGGNS